MSIPKEIEFENHGKKGVWKLKKTLYGLPQAPKAFFEHISTLLISKKFKIR
jgi:hypothetical protein